MKLKSVMLAALLGLGASASAQTVINITGATAFRSAMNSSIIEILGGPTVCKYAYVGTTGLSGSNVAIFEGSIGGQPFIIRTSQSGSTQGVKDVVQQNTLSTYLDVAATASDRVVGGAAISSSGKTASAIARFSFSDVDQSQSETPTPALPGAPVGVVPFVFLANVGSTGITNITDQLHNAQWSLGELPKSMYTGNAADTSIVYNTGRNNGSGTRATILSETRYGTFTNVVQWTTATTGGSEGTGTVTAIGTPNNGGYSSNSGVRTLLSRSSANVSVSGGTAGPITIISYLTLSDATAISDVVGTPTSATVAAAGSSAYAIDLTYNGVPYSENNVKNGAYTLWGYQQFYGSVDITAGEQTFFNAFTTEIPDQLNPLSTGIKISEMAVTRFGGDGGTVLP
jgi:hypothetical protein